MIIQGLVAVGLIAGMMMIAWGAVNLFSDDKKGATRMIAKGFVLLGVSVLVSLFTDGF